MNVEPLFCGEVLKSSENVTCCIRIKSIEWKNKAGDAARILIDSLENTPTLIVIDDFHKVSDAILFQTIQS